MVSKAGVDLVLIQTSLLFICIDHTVLMLTSLHLQSWFTRENLKTYAALATNILTFFLFSDEHLKNNVTTLPHSQYNNI